jgi:hypothetical protein
MQIKGKKRFVRKAVCFASALEVHGFSLSISLSDEGSSCAMAEDGTFHIAILKGLTRFEETEHLAHEMVHLRQYKHGHLIGACDEGVTVWKGQKYFPVEYMSDDYFLSPWEMEARALEGWLVHKWETRQRELH